MLMPGNYMYTIVACKISLHLLQLPETPTDMTTYLAAVMPAPNAPIELREFNEPALEPGAALLETMYSEVCGTDVHLHHGKLSGVPYPIIPGHVSVGRVAKVRGALRGVEGAPIKEGDVG